MRPAGSASVTASQTLNRSNIEVAESVDLNDRRKKREREAENKEKKKMRERMRLVRQLSKLRENVLQLW